MNTWKKIILLISITIFGIICCACGENTDVPLLRLHIRADSNDAADQAVKLKVRDAVVLFLESEMADVDSFEQAKREIEKRKIAIKKVADEVLDANGFSYRATVKVCNEYFPARMYEDLVVESGYYDALIIELGSGNGDNWWCVVYPPLCYLEVTEGSDFKYKSKIKELIDKYF